MMANNKRNIVLVALLLVVAMMSECCLACIETEKQALLSFKQDLIDPLNFLASWDDQGEECCKWDRIVCDNVTGRVSQLQLSSASLSGNISPSLLNLKHLTHLDLSYNHFRNFQIPTFLGSLVSLTYLDLTYPGGLVGTIPTQLRNLSHLRHFSVACSIDDALKFTLHAKNLDWLSGLSSLRHLEMTQVNLSGEASNDFLLQANKLSSLSELVVRNCELGHIELPSNLNLTSIRLLDLRDNNIEAPFPCSFLKNMSHLESLALSRNSIDSASLACLRTISGLRHLRLERIGLQGVIPSAITNLTSLVTLDLSSNSLQGEIPSSLGSLCNLKILDLASNMYRQNVSEAFQSLSSGCLSRSLDSLYLDLNSFTGEIPDRVAEFKNLTTLWLDYNKLSGPIPVSLGSLSNLKYLDTSSNGLQGIVSEAHFANLTNLKSFDAFGNSLTLSVSPDWTPPFHLDYLDLGHWNLAPQFPLWLKTQKDISGVGLSGTGISGVIPTWFWNLSDSFDRLDLSDNRLRGEIPDLRGFNNLFFVDLGSNELTGSLPRISSLLRWLDLSSNALSGEIFGLLCNTTADKSVLSLLRLGDNLLTGNIPDCWEHWRSLSVIGLNSNSLEGEIPGSMGLLNGLLSLNLGNNILTGEIPDSLKNCSILNAVNLSRNKFVGMVPRWMGTSLPSLSILILRSNKLSGRIPVELCALVDLQILDLADNNLSETIPHCLKNAFAVILDRKVGSITYFSMAGGGVVKENAVTLVTFF